MRRATSPRLQLCACANYKISTYILYRYLQRIFLAGPSRWEGGNERHTTHKGIPESIFRFFCHRALGSTCRLVSWVHTIVNRSYVSREVYIYYMYDIWVYGVPNLAINKYVKKYYITYFELFFIMLLLLWNYSSLL